MQIGHNMDNNRPLHRAKTTVDKFALILTGAPRGVSLQAWDHRLPQVYKNTVSSNDSWSTSHHDYWWQEDRDPPEVHVFVCATNFDSMDRYLRGEDPRLAGLDPDPYIDYEDQKKATLAFDMIDDILHYRDEHGTVTGGKMKLKKEKWEQHHLKAWDWATSVNFVYWDGYQMVDDMHKHFLSQGIETNRLENTTWHNQYLHMLAAYEQHKEFFDSLTEQSVVFRQRYDLSFNPYQSLWRVAQVLQTDTYSNQNNPEEWNWHEQGFRFSPKVLVPNLHIFRGLVSAGDYWSAFDGPGTQLFVKKYLDYLKQDPDHWAFVSQTIDHGTHIRWRVPEHSLPQFCMQHNYTILHLRDQEHLGTRMLSLKDPPILDQWRYEWYDWTPEMVEEIRQKCS